MFVIIVIAVILLIVFKIVLPNKQSKQIMETTENSDINPVTNPDANILMNINRDNDVYSDR